MAYQLTIKGKVAVGAMILTFFIGMTGSLMYIIDYFNNSNDYQTVDDEKQEPIIADTIDEKDETVTKDLVEEEATDEESEQDDIIYTQYDLNVLKDFLLILEFDSSQLLATDEVFFILDEKKDVFKAHSQEKLVIESYVSERVGWTTIGENRLNEIVAYLMALGIDSDNISVYNYKLSDQSKDMTLDLDSILIYYKDHYKKIEFK